ncbi:MAG: hypothetical protein J6T06_07630 [Victivallales bacterium]|nr:hypothetical protein [Victivallales bacterium]
MNYRKRYSLSSRQEDVDPMGSLVNLFDVAMVLRRGADGCVRHPDPHDGIPYG